MRKARSATSAPRVVSVDAMMMRRPGSARSNNGSADMPSSTGISMSSTSTSTETRRNSSSAARPLATLATTLIAGSASRMRAIAPRITAESSQIITRATEASFADAPLPRSPIRGETTFTAARPARTC